MRFGEQIFGDLILKKDDEIDLASDLAKWHKVEIIQDIIPKGKYSPMCVWSHVFVFCMRKTIFLNLIRFYD